MQIYIWKENSHILYREKPSNPDLYLYKFRWMQLSPTAEKATFAIRIVNMSLPFRFKSAH